MKRRLRRLSPLLPPSGRLLGCFFGAALLAGCGSIQLPRTLSPSERVEVEAGSVPAVVGVVDARWAADLRRILDESGLFERVELLSELEERPDLIATVEEPCNFHRGGFIPLFTVLTLGIVPTWARFEFGYAFAFRAADAPGRRVVIGCGVDGRMVVGWLGTPLNVLPRWTLRDPEKHRRYAGRVALEVARRSREIRGLLGAPAGEAQSPPPASGAAGARWE